MKNRNTKLHLAMEFLIDSIDPNNYGSRAFFSRLYNPISGWSLMYPETTGYIIPTFITYGKKFKQEIVIHKAIEMADWLLSIQYDDGSFPGGLFKKGITEKSIFNSSQIIIGLVNIYNETKDDKYLEASIKCANWIVRNQSDRGIWIKYNYEKGFTPSYYTRVSWPLLMVWKLNGDQKLKDAAIKTLELIYNRKLKNGFIKYSGFKMNSYSFIHTIAYVIRGFFESSQILNNNTYEDMSIEWSKVFLRKFEINGKLPGAYFDNYKKVDYFECLTGYCQLAIIWFKIFNKINDPRFVNCAMKAIDRVSNFVPKYSFLKKKGGVPGSYPFYGKYMMFRQPNWATKFFIDAMLMEKDILKRIESKLLL